MKKQLLALLSVFALSLSVAACNEASSEQSVGDSVESSQSFPQNSGNNNQNSSYNPNFPNPQPWESVEQSEQPEKSESEENTESSESSENEESSESSESVESSGDGEATDYEYQSFTASEKTLLEQYLGEVIPFVANDEYYLESYETDYEYGVNFYTFGNTQADFNAYLDAIESAGYAFVETYVDDTYGDTWYYYEKGDLMIDVAYYIYGVIDLYAYSWLDGEDSSSGGDSSSAGDVESDLQSLTIAQFLSKKDTVNFYQLTGTVVNITNTTYGNFIFEDSTGEVFVWGLYPHEGSTDKYAFNSLGISAGDTITIAGRYKNYNGTDEVVDAYFISKNTGGSQGGSGDQGGETHLYTGFTNSEKALFVQYIGEVIPFVANDEYYVEGYYEETDYEHGMNFYTYGNTQAEFNAYLDVIEGAGYEFIETYVDDTYGDTWYWYEKDDIVIDVTYYISEYTGSGVIDLFVYSSLSTDLEDGDVGGDVGGGDVGGGDVGGGSNEDVITNAGKGLPTSANGVYEVDFTTATKVKDVTEQYYYLDGCPTTGNPAVLVIPVEFSDVTAASKGYTIANIEKAFNGASGTTDYYSVDEYFKISSYGQLDLDITVLDYWFRPAKSSSYYLNATMDYYGTETAIGDQMIMDEALAELSKTMDLSKFDSDNNGIIDAVVLINTLTIDFNGHDMNWAYRYWNIYTDDEDYYYEYDGVSANDYLWASYQFLYEDAYGYEDETAMNTYTFIHEFSHVLGADDYYDTSYSGEAPLGGRDLMDNSKGDHNPYTKFNYGWLTSSRLIVADGSVTLTLEAFSKNGDTIIIANNWDETLGVYQEYYVLTYYTNGGLNLGNGEGMFAEDGIVMYHVNASLIQEAYGEEIYYNVYNNNTDPSDSYGTKDNLIEFEGDGASAIYVEGDTSDSNIYDDQGNKISYVFTVDSIDGDVATLTFTKNA